ncbi:hypothetical protein I6J77_09890 [Rhodanobacter sp. FDAARGOS 1247]|uniref:hypothetical protein n=1 Tax=Rhodanobacter sp. FDAARGOS 1247 TaxID=2778082 RepID=UPI00194F86A1|nr:hypothetical protein [Rhodanobacter sp. FDAARGOS 1247]QRP62465.1 hypothetical protein I6J77_09890 [Rhodanobacter sp. FDAARGOS 1247]
MLFSQPNSYRGKIPLELYVELQNKFPQEELESDLAWLRRIKKDPSLYQKMFGTPQFKLELIQAVQRRAAIAKMAAAGATRQGKDWKAWSPAARYQEDMAREVQKSGKQPSEYAKEAYAQLLEQFDATTPVNGSVFWNGINELALMKKIDKWNSSGEIFGQLEATTAARYVNKQFVWEPGGAFANYFTSVSGKLGHAARGHVTAVCRCGLRNDSILTTTELPAMVKLMTDQIKAKKEPVITDFTIVVIEPILLPDQPYAIYTNNDLAKVSIVSPKPGKRISGRDDCNVDGQLSISNPFLQYYWAARGRRPETAAVTKIKEDLKSLITWP